MVICITECSNITKYFSTCKLLFFPLFLKKSSACGRACNHKAVFWCGGNLILKSLNRHPNSRHAQTIPSPPESPCQAQFLGPGGCCPFPQQEVLPEVPGLVFVLFRLSQFELKLCSLALVFLVLYLTVVLVLISLLFYWEMINYLSLWGPVMDSLPGSKTQAPHSTSTSSPQNFLCPNTVSYSLLVPVLPSTIAHLLMSHSQRQAVGSEESKTMEKAQKSFSSSSSGLIVLMLVISTLTLFPFTHGISLRFRDPAGLDSCQEPFSRVALTGSTSLTDSVAWHICFLISIPQSLLLVTSSLLSVCGSCSTQNHTFLRIWKIAASCLQLFSFLRAALSKRHPPTPWPPPFPAGIGIEHHTWTRAIPVRSPQPGRIACQHGRAEPDSAVPLLLPSWLHSEQVTSPDQRTSLHPWSHLRERQAVRAGTASHYRYSLMSL